MVLAFKHRGRPVQLRASAKGWAQFYLKKNPWNAHRRKSQHDYEQEALHQGQNAVNSILRDWLKRQITAVECGVLSFEAVFLPYMLTADGEPLLDKIRSQGLLAPPEDKSTGIRRVS